MLRTHPMWLHFLLSRCMLTAKFYLVFQRRLISEDKTSGSVMRVNNWKHLPVSWAQQMKNKDSEESSKGSDFVEQNCLEKQFQWVSVSHGFLRSRKETEASRSSFQLLLEEGPEVSSSLWTTWGESTKIIRPSAYTKANILEWTTDSI